MTSQTELQRVEAAVMRGGAPELELARLHFESLGPWATEADTARYLGISNRFLREQTRACQLLGLKFADGAFYFPTWQFADGAPSPEVRAVSLTLLAAYSSVEACIAWLAGAAYEGEADRRIDLLRAGHIELVTAWAAEDTNRILRP